MVQLGNHAGSRVPSSRTTLRRISHISPIILRLAWRFDSWAGRAGAIANDPRPATKPLRFITPPLRPPIMTRQQPHPYVPGASVVGHSETVRSRVTRRPPLLVPDADFLAPSRAKVTTFSAPCLAYLTIVKYHEGL